MFTTGNFWNDHSCMCYVTAHLIRFRCNLVYFRIRKTLPWYGLMRTKMLRLTLVTPAPSRWIPVSQGCFGLTVLGPENGDSSCPTSCNDKIDIQTYHCHWSFFYKMCNGHKKMLLSQWALWSIQATDIPVWSRPNLSLYSSSSSTTILCRVLKWLKTNTLTDTLGTSSLRLLLNATEHKRLLAKKLCLFRSAMANFSSNKAGRSAHPSPYSSGFLRWRCKGRWLCPWRLCRASLRIMLVKALTQYIQWKAMS